MLRSDVRVDDFTVLLSIHEVTPAYEDDVVRSCDMLDELGLSSYTLLVVPFYMLKRANSIDRHELFTEYLRSLGKEIALHGYSHMSKSGSPNEFRGMTTEKAVSRVRLGAEMFERVFGFRPAGYVPPEWESTRAMARALSTMNFGFVVDGNRILYSGHGPCAVSGSVISFGDYRVPVVDVLVEMELGGSLQIAVHPHDHRYPAMRELLVDLRDRLGYRFFAYGEYAIRP